jgi:hypothetical protein
MESVSGGRSSCSCDMRCVGSGGLICSPFFIPIQRSRQRRLASSPTIAISPQTQTLTVNMPKPYCTSCLISPHTTVQSPTEVAAPPQHVARGAQQLARASGHGNAAAQLAKRGVAGREEESDYYSVSVTER